MYILCRFTADLSSLYCLIYHLYDYSIYIPPNWVILIVTKHPGSTFDELSFIQNLLSLPLFHPQLHKLMASVSVLGHSPKVITLPISLNSVHQQITSLLRWLSPFLLHSYINIISGSWPECATNSGDGLQSLDPTVTEECLLQDPSSSFSSSSPLQVSIYSCHDQYTTQHVRNNN